MAARSRPALLVLAWFGLVLGSFGTLYAIAFATPYLASRDLFVEAQRAAFASRADPAPSGDPAQLEITRLRERAADALYSRRGVVLPLQTINLISSLLLFIGCAGALRGQAASLQVWSFAAAVSIPYTILDCLFTVVQSRDLAILFREVNGAVGFAGMAEQSFSAMVLMFKGAIEILYFAIAFLYLRRT